ncbi:hypothetical protein ACJX0J_024940, partial [Zea mays]
DEEGFFWNSRGLSDSAVRDPNLDFLAIMETGKKDIKEKNNDIGISNHTPLLLNTGYPAFIGSKKKFKFELKKFGLIQVRVGTRMAILNFTRVYLETIKGDLVQIYPS